MADGFSDERGPLWQDRQDTTFVNDARIGDAQSQRVVNLDSEQKWTKELRSISVSHATKIMQRNLEGFLDIELDKYIANHPQAYGLSDDDLTELHRRIVESVFERKRNLSKVPMYQFVSNVAGYLGYNTPNFLFEHDYVKSQIDVHELADAYVTEVAEGGGSGNPTSDTYMAFIDTASISGLILPNAPLVSAVSAVMSELRSKRGCRNMSEYDRIIQDPILRNHLAELTAYQMMLFRQVNPKRDHKVIEYTRIQSLMDSTWTKFYMALKRQGGRFGFSYIPPRTHLRSFDTSF
tara:strand:+ start:4061 stop:4939 length:879 start_codon:yes stop_codon:yes gene_type:complete